MIEAVFGFVGAVFGAALTYIATHRQLYSETVSKRRNIWLNEMREYISEMLAYRETIVRNSHKSDNQSRLVKYEIAKNQVLIRLNSNEEKHRMLEKEIIKLDAPNGYRKARNKIVIISRSILKEEWEKVKRESKGK